MSKNNMKLECFLQIISSKHTDFLLFGLLVFQFFKTEKNKNILLLGIPKMANFTIIFLYIFKFGLLNLWRKRYFVKFDNYFVGTFSIANEPDAIHVYSLTVNPQWRRLGIATYILNYVEAQAIRANKTWLEVSVHKTNSPAIRLYRNYGFIKVQESRWFFLLKKMVKNN